MKVYCSASEAYLGCLHDVLYEYDFKCAPRDQVIFEKTDYTFRVRFPTDESIVTCDNERNKVIEEYTNKEKQLYNSMSNNVKDFAEASKFWLKLANPDNTVNSAYGYLIWKNKSHGNLEYEKWNELSQDNLRGDKALTYYDQMFNDTMRTPWEYCLQTLQNDKDSRQALLRFSLPEHFWVGNKDMVCTTHGIFLIRDDKLNLSIVMRSNDLMLGLVYDLPWFCSLLDKMIVDLQPTYPNLKKGTYTHTVHSLHIYERDKDKVKKMLGVNN